jgi:hypothetical protein
MLPLKLSKKEVVPIAGFHDRAKSNYDIAIKDLYIVRAFRHWNYPKTAMKVGEFLATSVEMFARNLKTKS